jgi:hypothetical protein
MPTADAHPENYAFVLNVSKLVEALSFTLAPGHQLRRANRVEITNIKQTLQGVMDLRSPRLSWEYEAASYERLPEAEWRYFVISFPQSYGNTVTELEEVFSLAPLELRIGFTVVQTEGILISVHYRELDSSSARGRQVGTSCVC